MTHSTSYRAWWSFLIVAALALTTTGCVTTGSFPAANVTSVELSESNYEIVATDVAGEASAGYLLGISAGTGFQMSTLALARVQGEGTLYRHAIQNLWANFRMAMLKAATWRSSTYDSMEMRSTSSSTRAQPSRSALTWSSSQSSSTPTAYKQPATVDDSTVAFFVLPHTLMTDTISSRS